jgi:DNA-binding NarL/FixJ family response regulator
MAATHRVFVIWIHPLFHEAVHQLLSHPDIDWVGATSDHLTARDQIVGLCPDTILIEEGESGVPPEALEILEACSWKVRVVGLGMDDNRLIIYRREQRTVVQAEDLLHLIQNE